MNDYREPVTGRTGLLSPDSIGILYHASLECEDPVARLVTLAAIAPWDAISVASTPVENLDRSAGTLRVFSRVGVPNPIALGFEAASVLDLVIGRRRTGSVLVDAGGFMMKDDRDTNDYIRELLGFVDGRTLDLNWSFRLIRESVFADMVDHGVSLHVAQAQAGLGFGETDDLHEQRAAADWWSYRMGIVPPPAFALVDASRRKGTWSPRGDGISPERGGGTR